MLNCSVVKCLCFSPPSNMHGYLLVCSLNHNAQLQIYIHRMRDYEHKQRKEERGVSNKK